ncbi:Spt20 family-domain-containing protein [Pisolithus orientalis]|uniref:Spt20 family-domain-containing protein n=1 Tax=Pisolithus orientalis TaxID=936130 RepID=UPI00222403DB|nr:Spt20 family-domain-containing protein [Pisolithus orientalis]KAI6010883.1 Spt20 family-domain-containing protein [Pisolithus orientalis]
MMGYNITRSAEELLGKYESSPPSFSIHLYPDHWTLNNGPKFLYNSPVASFLDDIRAHRIPVDFSCMIVELLDYRPKRVKDPPPEKPERSRITLHPSDETLWTDLCLINQRHGSKFTNFDVLELEARILLHTAPPLCLDPDPHLTRVANHTLRVSNAHCSAREDHAIHEPENKSFTSCEVCRTGDVDDNDRKCVLRSYRILETLRRMRESRQAEAHTQVTGFAKVPSQQLPPAALQPATPSLAVSASHPHPPAPSSQPGDITQMRQSKKPDRQMTPENSRSTATPAPHPIINQLQTQTPTRSPPVNSRSPLPAHAYQVPAGTPITAHSPGQRGYTQSPRPPSAQAARSSPLASGSQLPHTDHRQQPTTHFIQVAPATSQSKPATPQVGYSTLPAPTPPPQHGSLQQTAQIPMLQPALPQPQVQAAQAAQSSIPAVYAHLQRSNPSQVSQAQIAAQARQQNGRATPQGAVTSRSPMVSAQGVRNSPVIQNQALAARSPMPNTASLPQQVAQSTILQPGMTQPTMMQATQQPAVALTTQHPIMAQPAQHVMSAYNLAQYHQITHPAVAQHPQIQVHLPGQPGNVAQQVSDGQQAMMMQYSMYSYYPQLAATGRRPQNSYRMPTQVNGQVPGMQPGLPQIQGKTTQAGVPGR